MEETKDPGTGLTGTIDFQPQPRTATPIPLRAATYAGIKVEHDTESYTEVLKYKRTDGVSELASTCGHIHT
jgi:hypothetical protein